MKKLIMLLVMVLPLLAQAQSDSKDYIIGTDDKKVEGRIMPSTPDRYSAMITFKDTEGNKTVYRPSDIKSWHSGEVVYESKIYKLTKKRGLAVFMRRLCDGKGKMKVYEYRNTSGEHSFTQTFLEKDGEMTEVEFGRFRKFAATYFEEAEELNEKIQNKEYKKKDLMEIVAAYNQWREFQWE